MLTISMITLIGTNAACFECETNLIAMGINVINNTNMNQLPFIRKTSNSNKRTRTEDPIYVLHLTLMHKIFWFSNQLMGNYQGKGKDDFYLSN